MSDACHELETSYCGVTAHQWWADYLVWEKLLNAHSEIEAIVEIGTGIGGFALYLQHQALRRGMDFRTFDIEPPQTLIQGFVRADVFESPTSVEELLDRPAILHCDGPNKPREIATFTPALCRASLAVVHDYGTAFLDKDIPPWMVPVHADLSAGGLTCILERTRVSVV